MAAFFWIFIIVIKNINTIQHILSISKQLIIKNNNLELRNFQKLLDFFSIFYYDIPIFKKLKKRQPLLATEIILNHLIYSD